MYEVYLWYKYETIIQGLLLSVPNIISETVKAIDEDIPKPNLAFRRIQQQIYLNYTDVKPRFALGDNETPNRECRILQKVLLMCSPAFHSRIHCQNPSTTEPSFGFQSITMALPVHQWEGCPCGCLLLIGWTLNWGKKRDGEREREGGRVFVGVRGRRRRKTGKLHVS